MCASVPGPRQIFHLRTRRAEFHPGLTQDPMCCMYYLATVRCRSTHDRAASSPLPISHCAYQRARARTHANRCRDQRRLHFRSVESSSVSQICPEPTSSANIYAPTHARSRPASMYSSAGALLHTQWHVHTHTHTHAIHLQNHTKSSSRFSFPGGIVHAEQSRVYNRT